MVFYNEYLQPTSQVSKLGFSNISNIRIPFEYLKNKQFIIFRTCHSYGDWVLLSAMPRLLKTKYPDCVVAIPSPKCISKYFSPDSWLYKHADPFNNVIEIFRNNPYVDGMTDEIPPGTPIYHDHFRIYDPNNADIPIVKQMLKFWRFEENEMEDCLPELYWDDDEIKEGDALIKQMFGDEEFGFLYIDDFFFIQNPEYSDEMIEEKRRVIQKEILKHDLNWFYYAHDGVFRYKTNNNKVLNVKDFNMSLRVQNYIKSKSKLIIGHQGGYGTDCMPRYTQCYVIPLWPGTSAEHILIGTNYLM